MKQKKHRIEISDNAYEYLKGMIDDEHIENGNMSEERDENGNTLAYKPTFSEVIGHLIEERETG
jgi:predicted CopG family antitoxin